MGIYNSGAVEMQVLVTPAYVKVFFFLFSQIIRSLQALWEKSSQISLFYSFEIWNSKRRGTQCQDQAIWVPTPSL